MASKRLPDRCFIAAAKRLFHNEGTIEVDENAKVSRGDDNGAYVQAWVWVDNDEVHRNAS